MDSPPPPATDTAAPPALRLTRGIALAWILVNAASPMLHAVGWTALNKEVRPDDSLVSWLPAALAWLGAFALPAPLLLQAWVLRRAAPALPWWQIVPAMLLAWAVAIAATVVGSELHLLQWPFWTRGRLDVDFVWQELLGLPWFALIGRAGAVAAVSMLLPVWVFARAARVRWSAPLLGVVGASLVVALISALWLLAGVDVDQLNRSAMNGWSWQKRASALLTQGTAQATWAAVALLIFTWGVRGSQGAMPAARKEAPGHRPGPAGPQMRLLIASVLVAALLVPGATALLTQNGGARLRVAAQRALSPPPAQDMSEGEPLLQYALTTQVRVRLIPRKASLSPDGRWIVAVASNRQVVVIDAATGAVAHRLPDVLSVQASPEWAWSPDSRWLALRTDGEVVPGRYVRHQTRLRLFAVPGFAPAGDYRHQGAQCLSETYVESAVLFDQAGQAVWLACGLETQPTPTDLLALRLAVPNLTVQTRRRYGEAAPWRLRGLKYMGPSTWAWHSDQRAPYVRVRDLDLDRVPVILQPMPADRSGGPEWTLQDVRFDEERATLRFTAWSERRQRQLVHDMRSGAMVSQTEGGLPPGDSPHVVALAAGDLRIESQTLPTSRAGELVVVDAESGRVRQRIRTLAQQPLSVSADGRRLVTQADDELRVYRIQRAPDS